MRIWDPATGTTLHTLTGHTDAVLALAAAPDGSWLASAGGDGTVQIWVPATGTALHSRCTWPEPSASIGTHEVPDSIGHLPPPNR